MDEVITYKVGKKKMVPDDGFDNLSWREIGQRVSVARRVAYMEVGNQPRPI
jgi:hypothetical protein